MCLSDRLIYTAKQNILESLKRDKSYAQNLRLRRVYTANKEFQLSCNEFHKKLTEHKKSRKQMKVFKEHKLLTEKSSLKIFCKLSTKHLWRSLYLVKIHSFRIFFLSTFRRMRILMYDNYSFRGILFQIDIQTKFRQRPENTKVSL